MEGSALQQIRGVLLNRRNEIRSVSSDFSAKSREGSGPQAELIDIAQTLEQIDRETTLAEQERRELLAIERALAKMATGTFGYCEECGEEIPFKRLMVLPEARLCAKCQAFEERQQARTRGFSGTSGSLAG